jgi:hypothetical protein
MIMAEVIYTDPFALPVVHTLEKSGLDLNKCIVVGGSALALHGIRPAADVDAVVEIDYWIELYHDGGTPGGVPLEVNYGGSLFPVRMSGVSETEDMPLDIITFFQR